ncbi:hypothetical protein I5907_14995 [Panacibacter sp. DH6]|uniref:Secreted protein n=1 Tax=Panacibacter microcysteis TaxID=2793269 RepID=A0A931GY72_9BACT|nr:hypothetical protein [Panacibacter microcysteis]MBG9377549.1 hypothetical protein [Panacibacter microcysteis]
MKAIAAHIVRATLLLTLYVCCSSLVCCEAVNVSLPETTNSTTDNNNKGFNKHTIDEEITPLRLISIRLTELL